jgi:hypothetical protein
VGRNGDPQGDDYGLPHIDIVVPDDARELDRDVVAYRREQRQRRRRARWRRLVAPFTRYGLAAPIIAAALLIAVASGTMLTVFGPHSAPKSTAPPLSPRPTARAGQIGGPLPDAQVTIGGEESALIDHRPAVIIMVPPGCQCDAAVSALARQAAQRRIGVYVVAGPRDAAGTGAATAPPKPAELRGLAKKSATQVLEDDEGVLVSTYHPKGLTAVLVHTDGIVGGVVPVPPANQNFGNRLEPLQRPGQGVAATIRS